MANGPLCWSSKRQPTVSRSSTESEYRALSDGIQEAVLLWRMLLELVYLQPQTLRLHCGDSTVLGAMPHKPIEISRDNQGALKLARNPTFHAKTKHIELHHHFVRERVIKGEISLHYAPTTDQPAEILIKSLGRPRFEFHRSHIGLTQLSNLHPTILIIPKRRRWLPSLLLNRNPSFSTAFCSHQTLSSLSLLSLDPIWLLFLLHMLGLYLAYSSACKQP